MGTTVSQEDTDNVVDRAAADPTPAQSHMRCGGERKTSACSSFHPVSSSALSSSSEISRYLRGPGVEVVDCSGCVRKSKRGHSFGTSRRSLSAVQALWLVLAGCDPQLRARVLAPRRPAGLERSERTTRTMISRSSDKISSMSTKALMIDLSEEPCDRLGVKLAQLRVEYGNS